jgi:tripartite-type tricarboxylate transporter receptor subunit TctC
MHRRTLLRAGALALAAPSIGRAQTRAYPSGPITLVVPYAAGGNADLIARLFADALTKTVGQAVIVDNRAGGGGAIGATMVVGAKPDGYTVLFSAPSVFSVTPHLVKVGYTVSSIRPVCLVSKTPLILVARKGGRFQSLNAVVQAAKAEPGIVPIGYGGLGTPNHLAMLNLESVAQIRFSGVPYKGSAPMLQDLLGGQIDIGADQISTSKPYIDSGGLVPLAVFGSPLALLPGVPSVSSLGAEPFDVSTVLGIAAPVGTPDAQVASLQAAANKAVQDERFVAGMDKLSSSVFAGSGQDYDRFMRSEDKFFSEMITSGRVKPE